MEPLLTTDDVAEFFRVDVVTIRRMIGKGDLTAYRVGGEYRFKRADIDEYLERQRLPCVPERRGRLAKLSMRGRELASGASREMFERFTDRARNVLVLGQDEARRLNHGYLGTEHVLLGIVREGDGIAARMLSDLGIDLARARSAVESRVGRGEQEVSFEISLTARLKKVLQLAVVEAKSLGQADVGAEHLLLGLLREGEGVAAKVLGELGMDLDLTRKRMKEAFEKRDG